MLLLPKRECLSTHRLFASRHPSFSYEDDDRLETGSGDSFPASMGLHVVAQDQAQRARGTDIDDVATAVVGDVFLVEGVFHVTGHRDVLGDLVFGVEVGQPVGVGLALINDLPRFIEFILRR
ncbi:hypothetical protein D3C86_1746140 [compost metagenome]